MKPLSDEFVRASAELTPQKRRMFGIRAVIVWILVLPLVNETIHRLWPIILCTKGDLSPSTNLLNSEIQSRVQTMPLKFFSRPLDCHSLIVAD